MGKKLILFIHGLAGNASDTWGMFPELFRSHDFIGKTHTVAVWEYPTGVLAGKPDLQLIADGLKTTIDIEYNDFKEIIIIAHSQGGLIARRY